MKRQIALISLLASTSAFAFTVTAMLVSQSMGTTVTGQQVRVCIYQYNGQNFRQLVPPMSMCPASIQLQ